MDNKPLIIRPAISGEYQFSISPEFTKLGGPMERFYWQRWMIDRYDQLAQKSGAKVPCK